MFEDDKGEVQEDNGPSVEEVQEILNWMILQSKSANFCKIFCFIMDWYNHLIVWPCNCWKWNWEYDLLKPPYRFYNFLNIVSVFILWQVIVFAVAVLYISYKSVDNMAIYYYIPLLVGCAFIASPITMCFIYVFYRIYVHNIQSAFTYNIVSDRYWELEKEPEKWLQVQETEKNH